MAVTVVFAGAADGDVGSNGASYVAAVGGAGTFSVPVNSANELWEGQLFFATYSNYLSYVDFDLSGIPVGSTVTSAVMQTWLVTDQSDTDFNCIALGYDWGASVTSADWLTPGTQQTLGTWWTTINTSGIGATGAYKSWSDTTDVQALLTSLAGTEVNWCLSTDRFRASLAPAGAEYVTWSSSNVAGTTQDPKITITHHQTLIDHTGTGGLLIGGAAEIGFADPNASSASVTSGVVLEVDADNDGDFSETVEDWTDFLIACEVVTGRDFPSGLTGETRPGQLKATLDNTDDRFSYFNTASPLATAPFSLRPGRKVRLRTATSVPDDPVLLARDRFDRADGPLGNAETGQAWTTSPGGFTVRGKVAAADPVYGTDNVALVDVGQTEQYVQATLRQLPATNDIRHVGLYARYFDVSNYTRVSYDTIDRRIEIVDNNAGSLFLVATSATFDAWEGMTIGLAMVGSIAIAYVGGAEVCRTGTLTRVNQGDKAGLFALYSQFTGRSPEIGDFHVWDHVEAEVSGILWTGDTSDLEVNVAVDSPKVATLSADGRLVRAAAAEIASPRVVFGAPTGLVIGDVLHRAGLLHPPAPLDVGAVTTGPVGIPDGKALGIARQLEDTEQGILYETNEGAVTFQDATARAAASSQAWFSDTAGVGQYPYSHIAPVDRRGQLINRVTAGVAAEAPGGVSWVQRSGGGHVDVLLPTVTTDDLVVIIVANSQTGGQDWHTPIWWTNHRDLKGALGMRVYSHWCIAADSGTTVRLRTWNGAEVGVWLAHVVRIQDWFKGNNGYLLSEVVSGYDPAALDLSWGRDPTLFLACVTGIGGGGGGGMSFSGVLNPPDGYDWLSGIGGIGHGVADAQDVGMLSAYKIDITDAENPTTFFGLNNALIAESAIFAVRGYNGPHTKATLENPNTVGGDGRFVTVDNLTSQADHNAVLSHRAPSDLFATEADAEAYGTSVTTVYGEERPIIELSFWAMATAALRDQAAERRVGHKITVTANGTTGLGIEADFFIENVSHQFSDGGTKWKCTWQLSPA